MKKIFISYSHKDEKWKERLSTHLKALKQFCSLDFWDDRRIRAGAKWEEEIRAALDSADAAILLISADFLASDFIMREEIPAMLQKRAQQRMEIFPLIVWDCAWQKIPWLSAVQARPKDGKPLAKFKKADADSHLASFVNEIVEITNQAAQPGSRPLLISIGKMPTTGPYLFGRDEQLAFLDQAWNDPHIYIVILLAWGGVGKTALINRWRSLMDEKDYCGAKRVYAWSFYSQGAAEGKQASADDFMNTALEWFGASQPQTGSDVVDLSMKNLIIKSFTGSRGGFSKEPLAAGGVKSTVLDAGSPVDKARLLVHLLRQEKTLLILDGLEPLQYPPNELKGFAGRLKDQGLKTLLKELAGGQPGLCVITSRESVTDLDDKKDHAVREIELENLPAEAGVELLKKLGVRGGDKELAAAVQEYEGHALALTLLGNYLSSVFDGDIRKRDKIPALTQDKKKGSHARRVMEAYERRFGESPELDFLRIMGLFDRPAAYGAIEALLTGEAIPGITAELKDLPGTERQWAIANLRSAGLLAKNVKDVGEIGERLDCHPLVREHFGEKLREQNPEGWREAHKRLYEYFKALPEKEFPDTLAEMEPLFAAVSHGCAAGLHQQALVDVYWPRIRRRKEAYIVHKLGAFGADLAALSHFFDVPWTTPAPGLKDHDKASVLSWAGFGLRGVGRLIEALQPMKAGLEMRLKQENWKGAARNAGNLSELMLTMGRVDQAVDYARQSVKYADKSEDWAEKMTDRTTLADALHQQGELDEAEKLFLEAEALQQERQPQYRYLYSLRGYQFCDLLLSRGRAKEVKQRAEQTIEISKENRWLLDISLDNLSLGRARLLLYQKEKTGDLSRAQNYLRQAVDGLRKSGNQDDLPRGLLARAEFYRLAGRFDPARTDLQEALEIAESGGMKLYLCDYHLEAGRLCLAEGCDAEAKHHFQAAAALIEETGYHRRDGEIEVEKVRG